VKISGIIRGYTNHDAFIELFGDRVKTKGSLQKVKKLLGLFQVFGRLGKVLVGEFRKKGMVRFEAVGVFGFFFFEICRNTWGFVRLGKDLGVVDGRA
jgi:hypothetical protein